jgi:hypothetical protein
MGKIRNREFDAVIGIGGMGSEPHRCGIAGKLNWIGIGPHKTPIQRRGQMVTFDHFRRFEKNDRELWDIAPRLAARMYATYAPRHLISNFTDEELKEIEAILRLAKNSPPSARWRANSRLLGDCSRRSCARPGC